MRPRRTAAGTPMSARQLQAASLGSWMPEFAAILTYIACVATNALYGILYALSFGVGTVVPLMIVGALVGFLPERTFKCVGPLRVSRAICGVILLLSGLQLFYSI